MRKTLEWTLALVCAIALFGCGAPTEDAAMPSNEESAERSVSERLGDYVTVRLDADLSALSDNQKRVVGLLIDAGDAMDAAFWEQAYGDKTELLASIEDPDARAFVKLNYGPWDRLDDDKPFIEGVGPKPAGSNIFPRDLTKEAFDAYLAESDDATRDALTSLYTKVVRDESGALVAIPYSEAYSNHIERAASLLEEAATLAEIDSFKNYLALRAKALRSDQYRESDMAWMAMKDNVLDVVVGPIETYEESICGCKAAFETFVLLKDLDWSQRLQRYASLLPRLQADLPVPDAYKQEDPGSDSDLGAYEVLYYAGDCNAGAKTIAINLPNDEQVQLAMGSRRLQLKNAMQAKFDQIVLPISQLLVAEDQRQNVKFDAFFANVMFHEVAHGLGIKNTLTGKGTVGEALANHNSAIEENKADILGLYLVSKLQEWEELDTATEMKDHLVTFMAGIFRSVRFGAARAHGKANMITFNFFLEQGAFSRDGSGVYRVDEDKMLGAVEVLAGKVLTLQGDGDYEGVTELIEQYGSVGEQLQADLDRLEDAGVPVDVTFEQGRTVLGL